MCVDFVSCYLAEFITVFSEIFRFSAQDHFISEKRYFTSSIPIWMMPFISFPCLIALTSASSIMLNKSGKVGILVLFLIVEEKLSFFHHWVWHSFENMALLSWGSFLLFILLLFLYNLYTQHVGLEFTTTRSRVRHSTDWASQAPWGSFLLSLEKVLYFGKCFSALVEMTCDFLF